MRVRAVLLGTAAGALLLVAGCDQGTTGGESPVTTTSAASRAPTGTGMESSSQLSNASATTTTTPPKVTKVFDADAMDRSVQDILTKSYGIKGVQEVSCPPGQEVTDGNTFDCDVTIGGQRKMVTITVQGEEGEYLVGQPG